MNKRTFMLWSIAGATALLAGCFLTGNADLFQTGLARLAVAWQLCNIGLYYLLKPGRGEIA